MLFKLVLAVKGQIQLAVTLLHIVNLTQAHTNWKAARGREVLVAALREEPRINNKQTACSIRVLLW